MHSRPMLGTREPPPSRASLVIGLYGALALLGLLVSAGRGDADIYRVDEDRAAWWLVASILCGLALGLAMVLLTRVVVARFAWARALHRDFRAVLGDSSPREIAILAAASAIGEELLFRGALQAWLGVVPQAVLFGLLHVGPRRRHLVWTAWAFALGLAFGGLVEATGDLGGVIVAHFAINFLNLHFIVRAPDPAPAGEKFAPIARRT